MGIESDYMLAFGLGWCMERAGVKAVEHTPTQTSHSNGISDPRLLKGAAA